MISVESWALYPYSSLGIDTGQNLPESASVVSQSHGVHLRPSHSGSPVCSIDTRYRSVDCRAGTLSHSQGRPVHVASHIASFPSLATRAKRVRAEPVPVRDRGRLWARSGSCRRGRHGGCHGGCHFRSDRHSHCGHKPRGSGGGRRGQTRSGGQARRRSQASRLAEIRGRKACGRQASGSQAGREVPAASSPGVRWSGRKGTGPVWWPAWRRPVWRSTVWSRWLRRNEPSWVRTVTA